MKNPTVDLHNFAMVPRSEVPRSRFRMEKSYKTSFDSSFLVPFYVDEVLPGDSFNVKAHMVARLATPIVPVMDNLVLETFFFFVPYRLLWDNWVKLMGERAQPQDSTDFLVPQMVSPAGGYGIGTLFDYMGLPTLGQVGPTDTVSHSCLPLRAYNLVYREWFRDQNLIDNSYIPPISTGDGPDLPSSYLLARRGKRHDYFSQALPWTQKSATPVSLPLGTTAPVISTGTGVPSFRGTTDLTPRNLSFNSGVTDTSWSAIGGAQELSQWDTTALVADLSAATAATINQIRQAFQIQRLLEKDARGGTRYSEMVNQHFGVQMTDAKWRPVYLGGGKSYVSINQVVQTAMTLAGSTPQGNVAAFGTVSGRHGFNASFDEHGCVLGIMNVRADLTYQQGLRRMWSRRTRFDFYHPVFQALGEQAVLNKEIYCVGSATGGISSGDQDMQVFGYVPRWDEYRYQPSEITSLMRSTAASTIDIWHLAQHFTALPTLNATFISENVPMERILAVGAAAAGQQFLLDCFFQIQAVRPLPMYSHPGMIDHF